MITPLIIKENFRVEAEVYPKYGIWSIKDAQIFADYLETLKGVKAMAVWDTFYVCPNCKCRADFEEDLIACCEMNMEEDNGKS